MSTTPQTPTQPHPQDTDAHRQALNDLITMGTDLARLLHQQATAHAHAAQAALPPTPAPTPDTLIALTTAFDRIARAVRRSITLARTLDAPLKPVPDPAHQRAAARKRILREVEDAITRNAHDPGRARYPGSEGTDPEDLTAELHDRLDGPDLDADLATRPIAEVITEICRDLGLAAPPGTHPWKRRTPQDIQDLCARAAAGHPGTTQPGANPPGPAHCRQPHPSSIRLAPNPPAPAYPGPAHATALPRHHVIPGRWRPPPPA